MLLDGVLVGLERVVIEVMGLCGLVAIWPLGENQRPREYGALTLRLMGVGGGAGGLWCRRPKGAGGVSLERDISRA